MRQNFAKLSPHQQGVLLAFVGAGIFSAKAIVIKLCYHYEVDAITLLMYRMLFALPFFLAMAYIGQRGKPPLPKKDVLQAIGVGVLGYYLASYLNFLGLQYITAGLERLILYLNPTMVLVLGFVLYRTAILKRQVWGMLVSYLGVVLVFWQEVQLEGDAAIVGALFVLGSALCYALYLVLGEQVIKKLGSLRMAGIASSTACVLCIGQFLLLRPLSAAAVHPDVITLSLLNATVCTALPIVMVLMAVERIGSALVSQIGMIGPVATIMLGVWLLGEPFNSMIVVGTVLVLSGVYIASRKRT